MHKIDSLGATPEGEFQDQNLALGIPGTRLTAQWLNTIQRELISVLTAAGQKPEKLNDNQLRDAFLILVYEGLKNAGAVQGVPPNLGNLYWQNAVLTVADLPENALAGTMVYVRSINMIYRFTGTTWTAFFNPATGGEQTSFPLQSFATPADLPEGIHDDGTIAFVASNSRFYKYSAAISLWEPYLSYSDINYGLDVLDGRLDSSEGRITTLTTELNTLKTTVGNIPIADAAKLGGLVPQLVTQGGEISYGKMYAFDTSFTNYFFTMANRPANSGPTSIALFDVSGTFKENALMVAPPTGYMISGLAPNVAKTLGRGGVFYWLHIVNETVRVVEFPMSKFVTQNINPGGALPTTPVIAMSCVRNGESVQVHYKAYSGTTTSLNIITLGTIPAEFRPKQIVDLMAVVVNNTTRNCRVSIGTNGLVTLYLDIGSPFQSGQTVSWQSINLSYMVV